MSDRSARSGAIAPRPPTPSRRLVPVALLASFAVGAAVPARADLVQTVDGKWHPWPADLPPTPPDQQPPEDAFDAGRGAKVDATYESVTSNRGFKKPADQVLRVISDDSRSAEFGEAVNEASAGGHKGAAEMFRQLAQSLSGLGKQEALWAAVQSSADSGDPKATTAAIDELLAAFPKSFWMADAQILRARIAAGSGDVAGAAKALDAVKTAPGMNVRDLYRAERTRVLLTLELQRKYDAAAAEYRTLIERMDRERDQTAVGTTKQQCMVGLGNCLVAAKKEAEARSFFERAAESRDVDVLAGAYAGLGDIAFGEARVLRDGGKLPEAKAKLEEAVRHYLRVTDFYGTSPRVTDPIPVLRSLENGAKVFTVLFDMSAGKDCEQARRAYRLYKALFDRLPDSPARKQVQRDATDIDRRLKACQGEAK